MKNSTKVLLGIGTFWPVLYIGLFVLAILMIFVFAASQGGDPGPEPGGPASILIPFGFMAFFGLHFLTLLDILALKVFYIVHAAKAEYLDQNMKLMWILFFIFATIIAEPVFWYLYIWRDPKPALPRAQPAPWQRSAGTETPGTPASDAAHLRPNQPPDWR